MWVFDEIPVIFGFPWMRFDFRGELSVEERDWLPCFEFMLFIRSFDFFRSGDLWYQEFIS